MHPNGYTDHDSQPRRDDPLDDLLVDAQRDRRLPLPLNQRRRDPRARARRDRRGLLEQLPPAGTPAELHHERDRHRGTECYQLVWLDEPTQPYAINLDTRQADRRIPARERGSVVPLIWYRPGSGPEDVVEVRRETITIAARP